MKKISTSGLCLIIGCIFTLIVVACEGDDPIVPDTDPDSEQQTEDDTSEDDSPEDDPSDPDQPESNNAADEISQALLFNNAQLKTGSLPPNSNLSDLKIDKDTINLWPGVKGRIRILNPDELAIGGVLVHISGASNYHEVPIVVEESTDSISVFYVDLNPDGLNLPHDGDIVISPVDPGGTIIDEFDHPVHIDPPFDEEVGAGPDGNDQGNCPPKTAIPYLWIYTTVNGEFDDAPGYPHTGSYEVEGCCDRSREPHNSVPCLGKPPTDKVVVNNQYSVTNKEFIKLFGDAFAYQLSKSVNNFDYDASNFCEGQAGYSFSNLWLFAIGDYSYAPANSFETFYEFTIHSLDIEARDGSVFPRVGRNENSHPAYVNCSYLVWTSTSEESVITSVFERQPEGQTWHD